MRVVSCMLLFAVLCLTGTGCSLFKKNANTNGPGGNPPTAKFPGGKDPLLPTPPPPTFPTDAKGQAAANTSILAGTVIDAYHRPVSNAYIRWVNLEEKDAGAPIDVAADANGHFIIQGVRLGARYKLIARTKQGERMMAGVSLTNAPDPRVVITVSEDLVTADIPPLPGAPTYNKTPDQGAPGESKLNANDPLMGIGGAKKTDAPNLPAAVTVPNTPVSNPANSPTSTPTFVPGVVATPGKDRPPILSIPLLKKADPPRPPVLPPTDRLDTGPTRVPSCVLVGNRLENLALKDSKGQPWEYRKHASGKLVLLDFWGTYCPPCRETMPHLNRLQTQFGSRGLEVIGIALESGQDERKDAEMVNKACASLKVSYRQLMGRSAGFDVARQFKIDTMPTLLLVSETGDIIYHHVGRPDPAELATLERIIQSRLGQR